MGSVGILIAGLVVSATAGWLSWVRRGRRGGELGRRVRLAEHRAWRQSVDESTAHLSWLVYDDPRRASKIAAIRRDLDDETIDQQGGLDELLAAEPKLYHGDRDGVDR